MSKEIQRYAADEAMYTSEKSDNKGGPKAFMLAGTPDPLGSVAASALMYTGTVVRDKADVTDEQRRHYLREMQKTILAMPLEGVHLHFMLDDVTRGFTHQLVRQRTAAYAQESTRFAVKDDLSSAVAYPPSLQGVDMELFGPAEHLSNEQRMRLEWDQTIQEIENSYNKLINMGMPAEDARGLLPTNLLTRTNYITNLRGLKDHAGLRLCTQAQFEWRMVWVSMIQAMSSYCSCNVDRKNWIGDKEHGIDCDNWQWKAIAGLFRPVCYYTGKCQFQADFDRKCSIRDRVQANAKINRPSEEWHEDAYNGGGGKEIKAIAPSEWLLDAGAAR